MSKDIDTVKAVNEYIHEQLRGYLSRETIQRIEKCVDRQYGTQSFIQALTNANIKKLIYTEIDLKKLVEIFGLYYCGEIGYLDRKASSVEVCHQETDLPDGLFRIPYIKKSSVLLDSGAIEYTIESNPDSDSEFCNTIITILVDANNVGTLSISSVANIGI